METPSSSPLPAPGTNLFVASLPPGTDDAKLRELFRPFGKIVSAKVMVDFKTRTLRSHGFVRFDNAEDAQRAIASMHRRRIEEGTAPIHVVVSTHKEDVAEGEECEVVYVRNLPEGVPAEAIRRHFATFGEVNDVLIPPSTGSHLGVCFVRFSSIDGARRAVREAHNTTPFAADKALQVRFKESRRESQRRGQKKVQGRDSNATSPHGSPHDQSFSSQMSPNFFPLSVSPQNGTVQGTSSPPAMVLVPVGPAPPVQSSPPGGSPNYGTPMGTALQGGVPPVLPATFAQGFSDGNVPSPSQPQFSLSGSQPQPVQTTHLQTQIPQQGSPGQSSLPLMSAPAPQQAASSSPVTRQFPGANDLFFSNFCSQEWLLDLVRPFQPVLVQPGPVVIVRLRDESLHSVVAQSLNGMVGPTGMQLTAALVHM